jgi:NitT/TauT family transport system substrate-binding protein
MPQDFVSPISPRSPRRLADRRRRAVTLGAAISVVALALAACSSSGGGGGTTAGGSSPAVSTISIGLPGGSSQAHFWDYMAATELGLFTKNNLKVKIVDTKDAPTTVQALTAGRIDFGETASDSFVQAMDKGANITIIGQGSGSPEAMVGGEDVSSYAELKGKKIAVISTNAGTGLVVLKVLKSKGYPNPLSSFKFVLSGSTPARLAALESGAVDATILAPPSLFDAVAKGAHVLSYATKDVPVPEVYFATYKPYASKNPTQVTEFLSAMEEAANWLTDPANKAQAIQILMKYASGTTNAIATQTYDLAITQLKSFAPGVVPAPAGLEADLSLLGSDPSTYTKYADTSYATKAVAAVGGSEGK